METSKGGFWVAQISCEHQRSQEDQDKKRQMLALWSTQARDNYLNK